MTQRICVADEKLGILLRREQDLNRRVLEGTLDVNRVLAELQKIIEGELENILHIPANLSLSDRIAAGKYTGVNDNITEKNFPDKVEKSYKVEYRIFYFNRCIFSDSVIAEMEKEGFKPASIHELLKLGEIKPNLQKEFPIVALGSVWRTNNIRNVLVLEYEGGERRELDLDQTEDSWSGYYRFLSVRKVA